MSEPAEIQPPRLRALLPWAKEIAVIGVVYLVYSFIRNQFGSAKLKIGDEPRSAFNNALDVIKVEKAVGLFHERAIQSWFLGQRWIIQFFNIFYGTAHFAVTLGILIWIFIRKREVFSCWRTTLMVTTVLALIGFALFPLMPPRLLNAYPAPIGAPDSFVCVKSAENPKGDCYRYGGGDLAEELHQPNFAFVDTLRTVGGLWSFDSKNLDSVSNQYAAMPSLHIGWSTWCMLVLLRLGKNRWTKVVAVAYPLLTLTVIVATANHYILDAVGGLVILGAGWFVSAGIDRLRTRYARGRDVGLPADSIVEPAMSSHDEFVG